MSPSHKRIFEELMNFLRFVAKLTSRRTEPIAVDEAIEAEETTLHVEASRMEDSLIFPMDMSSEGILDKLDKDTIMHVLSLIDAPSDLAHVACVCCLWHRCVIEGKLWKKLCVKLFPEISRDFEFSNYSEGLSSNQRDARKLSRYLEEESSASKLLLKKLLKPPLRRTCVAEPLHASSTDNLPVESAVQTLYQEPVYSGVPSYWSSTGQEDTSVPEILTYRLCSDVCVVHDVKIRPFQAHFQNGSPIYSSEAVRFRFGYSRVAKPKWSGLFECFVDSPRTAHMDEYVWTYISPTFQMVQDDSLQTFRLPKPTPCFGDIFQIEFMGRVQTQESDNLYYICICHVRVTGRPLPDFKFERIDKGGKIVLKYLSGREKPSTLIQTLMSSDSLVHRYGPHLIEGLIANRIVLRNRSIVALLLQQLLHAGLLREEVESDEDDEMPF